MKYGTTVKYIKQQNSTTSSQFNKEGSLRKISDKTLNRFQNQPYLKMDSFLRDPFSRKQTKEFVLSHEPTEEELLENLEIIYFDQVENYFKRLYKTVDSYINNLSQYHTCKNFWKLRNLQLKCMTKIIEKKLIRFNSLSEKTKSLTQVKIVKYITKFELYLTDWINSLDQKIKELYIDMNNPFNNDIMIINNDNDSNHNKRIHNKTSNASLKYTNNIQLNTNQNYIYSTINSNHPNDSQSPSPPLESPMTQIETELELIICFLLNHIYLYSKYCIKINDLLNTLGFLAIGEKIITLFSDFFVLPDTLYLSAQIYLFLSSLYITNSNYETAINYAVVALKISYKELELRVRNPTKSLICLDVLSKNEQKDINKITTNITIALYHLGVCNEYLGNIEKSCDIYSQCYWFNHLFDDENGRMDIFYSEVKKRAFIRCDLINYFSKIDCNKEEIVVKKDFKKKFVNICEEKTNKKFDDVMKVIEGLKIKEIDDEDSELINKKPDGKTISDKVGTITKTVHVLNYLMSDKFRGIIKNMNKIEINNLDGETRDAIQKKIIKIKNFERAKIRKKEEDMKKVDMKDIREINRSKFNSNSNICEHWGKRDGGSTKGFNFEEDEIFKARFDNRKIKYDGCVSNNTVNTFNGEGSGMLNPNYNLNINLNNNSITGNNSIEHKLKHKRLIITDSKNKKNNKFPLMNTLKKSNHLSTDNDTSCNKTSIINNYKNQTIKIRTTDSSLLLKNDPDISNTNTFNNTNTNTNIITSMNTVPNSNKFCLTSTFNSDNHYNLLPTSNTKESSNNVNNINIKEDYYAETNPFILNIKSNNTHKIGLSGPHRNTSNFSSLYNFDSKVCNFQPMMLHKKQFHSFTKTPKIEKINYSDYLYDKKLQKNIKFLDKKFDKEMNFQKKLLLCKRGEEIIPYEPYAEKDIEDRCEQFFYRTLNDELRAAIEKEKNKNIFIFNDFDSNSKNFCLFNSLSFKKSLNNYFNRCKSRNIEKNIRNVAAVNNKFIKKFEDELELIEKEKKLISKKLTSMKNSN